MNDDRRFDQDDPDSAWDYDHDELTDEQILRWEIVFAFFIGAIAGILLVNAVWSTA